MKQLSLVILPLLVFMLIAGYAPEAQSSIGVGIHYLRSLEEIEDSDEFDENSIGYMASLLMESKALIALGGLKIEADIEYIPDYWGTDEAMILPQGYLLVGKLIYGGVGVGIGNYDGEWADDPFYALRGGVQLPLGEWVVDAFATYQFMKWDALEGLDDDSWNSITFGAILRF